MVRSLAVATFAAVLGRLAQTAILFVGDADSAELDEVAGLPTVVKCAAILVKTATATTATTASLSATSTEAATAAKIQATKSVEFCRVPINRSG